MYLGVAPALNGLTEHLKDKYMPKQNTKVSGPPSGLIDIGPKYNVLNCTKQKTITIDSVSMNDRELHIVSHSKKVVLKFDKNEFIELLGESGCRELQESIALFRAQSNMLD